MRGPSSRVLANRCVIYPFVPSQDADSGNNPAGNYPAASATAVPCSFQQNEAERRADMDGRETIYSMWTVFFNADPGVTLNTRIDLLASDGVTVLRTAYATAAIDGGGRGASWQVPCEERV